MILLLALGMEVVWAIGIVATIGLLFFVNESVSVLATLSWRSLKSFTLTSVPLFIFMGSILANSGVADYLFGGLDKWMSRLPGGLATTVILGNAVFGAMSGSSFAATAAFGKVAVPAMEKRGYDPKLGLGAVAMGATLVPLIPPSILLIIYAGWQGLSVVALFAAGLLPGLMLTVLFILTIAVRTWINPKLVPPPPKFSWKEKFDSVKGIIPFVVLIVGVLGAIFGGVMTPTEAASLGAFLSLVLALLYRKLSWSVFNSSLLETIRVSSFSLAIMVMAVVLSHVLNSTGITPRVVDIVLGWDLNKYVLLLIFLVMYFIMGCFFSAWSMLFLTFPLVMPVVLAAGFNPVWWGIFYVLAAEQNLVTPPFGLGLYILHSVAPQYSMGTIFRGCLPLLIPNYIGVAFLVAFPQIALWLPSLIGRI